MTEPQEPAHSLVAILSKRAVQQPDQPAYCFLTSESAPEAIITYQELDARARKVAAALRHLGLAGERVILFAPTGMDFVVPFFGVLYAGAVAVPMCPPKPARALDRTEAILSDTGAKLAIAPAMLISRLAQMHAKHDMFSDLRIVTLEELESLAAGLPEDAPSIAPGLALLQYTSGSTSTPKGVQITHRNLIHNAQIIQHCAGTGERSVGVSWLPLYHDMGLTAVIQSVVTGFPVVLMPPTLFVGRPLTWLQAISRHGGTITAAPNFAYELLCHEKFTDEQLGALDLSSWKSALCGAETIRADILDQFASRFERCGFRREAWLPCYGLAEATLMASGGPRNRPPVVLDIQKDGLEKDNRAVPAEAGQAVCSLVGSGAPVPEQRLLIVHPQTGTRRPDGHVGEIWIQGESVGHGYWNQPEATEKTFHAYTADTNEGPFLRTGDLGFLHGGQLFVTGRIKDLIIIRGVNHYPQDIELTVERSHPALRPHAGAAVAVEVRGEEQLVIVQEIDRSWNAGITNIMEEILRSVAEQHGVRPHAIVLIKQGSIARTSSGKIRHTANKAMFVDNDLQVVAQWRNEQPEPAPSHDGAGAAKAADASTNTHLRMFYAMVGKALRLPAPRIDPTLALTELGMDSLMVVELQLAIHEKFHVDLDAEELMKPRPLWQLGMQILVQAKPDGIEAPAATPVAEAEPAAPAAPQGAESLEAWVSRTPTFAHIRQLQGSFSALGVRNPYFTERQDVSANQTSIGGLHYINYSGYNYLGLSGHPAVSGAAKAAIDQYGTSVSASRLVAGSIPLHRELEREMSKMLGTEDCLAFVSGYGTNVSTIGHLFGPKDLLIHDSLIHNSALTGCLLSGGHRLSFPHNDWNALDQLLQAHRHRHEKAVIIVEGAYSMDGDFPDLPRLLQLKQKHNCFLMIDEAHSFGVLGQRGFGIAEHFDVDPSQVDLWMGTFSKALASCGGYIAGRAAVTEYLKFTNPGFIYSCGMPPADAAAALAAARVMQAEPERVAQLRENAALFVQLAKAKGLDTGNSGGTSVVPVILGDSALALRLAHACFENGINVHPIIHPAVEHSAARLRFFITALHTEDEIRHTVDALATQLARLRETAAVFG